jgi:hypothetical protein
VESLIAVSGQAEVGVDPDEFVSRFPCCWHMAEAGSWDSIVEHGLLSTSALLDLYEVDRDRRIAIESQRRAESFVLDHPTRGPAVVRDQRPLLETVLLRTLEGATIGEYCELLNRHVFFWVNKARLERLRNAPPYRERKHLILTVDTAELVARHADRIRLSHLNSGATHPAANYPRGPQTFQPFATYPWAERVAVNAHEPVVEVAVLHSVPDAADLVIHREER